MNTSESDEPAYPQDVVFDIVQRLSHRSRFVRAQAERELTECGPRAKDAILQLSQKESRSWRENRQWWMIGGFLVANMVMQPFYIGSHAAWWWTILSTAIFGLPLAVGTMFLVVRLRNRYTKLGRLAPAMCQYYDVRFIEPLLTAYPLSNKESRARIEGLLPGMLEGNHRKAWSEISSEARTDLILSLSAFRSDAASTAVLEWFTDCGDKSELRIARTLTKRAKSPAVRQAAVTCVAAIEARLEGKTDSSVLLRPSAGSADAESLLHPASGQHTDRLTLLQPAGGGGAAREYLGVVDPADH